MQSPLPPTRPSRLRAAALGFAVVSIAGALSPSIANAKTFEAAALKPVKGAIVGGTEIQIQGAPHQVVVGNTVSNGLCGGSIVDATHVVSAAHCFFDNNGTQLPAAQYTIISGASNFQAAEPGDDPQVRTPPAAVAIHPGYVHPLGGQGRLEQFADDVAVITLATPLDLNRATAASRTVGLPTAGANPAPGTATTVSGYGLQAQGAPTPNGNLYKLDTTTIDGAAAQGGSGPLNAIFVTTQSGNGSFCQGDSGGGLIKDGVLVGIVSNNGGCGVNEAVQYTSVSAGENLTFIRNVIDGTTNPIPLAPRGGENVSVSGPRALPRVGDVLTCSAGTWTNSPAFTYTFTDTRNGTVVQNGPSPTLTLTAADAGRTISCRVTAATAGGVGTTPPTTATPAVQAAPVATPTPTPTPAPVPTPTPAPRPSPTPAPSTPSAARLTAELAAGRSRVAQGSTVSFRLTVRNRGDVDARTVRSCVRVSSRFSVVSRGGASFSGGRLCWTNASLDGTTTKRFTLRADRDASVGRVSQSATITAAGGVRSASASRALTIARRASAPRPGGVTG